MGSGTQTHEGHAPRTRPGPALRGDERRCQGWGGRQEQAQSGWESRGQGAAGIESVVTRGEQATFPLVHFREALQGRA